MTPKELVKLLAEMRAKLEEIVEEKNHFHEFTDAEAMDILDELHDLGGVINEITWELEYADAP